MKTSNSFRKGVARSLDLGATLSKSYNVKTAGAQRDLMSMKGDWDSVGKYFQSSFTRFKSTTCR